MPEDIEEQTLTGVRVVEIAGPEGEWCGKLLADMGAEVIKVEPPEGNPSRSFGPFVDDVPDPARSLFFWHYNTNKRSVTANLATDEGRALVRRLIDGADILLETLAPGEARRLAFDYAALSATNRRLIHAALTPFGQTGPYVDAGYQTTDLISMALGGPMQSCGYDLEDGDLPPVRPGPYHSYHTGSHYACVAILAALWEREESGLGQFLDISSHAALAVTVEFASTNWEYDRAHLRRQTGRHAGRTRTARTQHLAADGKYINLGLPYQQAAWEKLAAYLREKGLDEGLPLDELGDPQKRFQMGSALLDVLQVLTSTATAEELFHLGQGLGMTWGAVRQAEDWLDDPHAAARRFFVQVEHPELGRTVAYPGAPYKFGVSPWALRSRAPLPGEDNAAVYGALGLSSDDLTALRESGAI